jgi:hypothetical protein
MAPPTQGAKLMAKATKKELKKQIKTRLAKIEKLEKKIGKLKKALK